MSWIIANVANNFCFIVEIAFRVLPLPAINSEVARFVTPLANNRIFISWEINIIISAHFEHNWQEITLNCSTFTNRAGRGSTLIGMIMFAFFYKFDKLKFRFLSHILIFDIRWRYTLLYNISAHITYLLSNYLWNLLKGSVPAVCLSLS